MSGYNCQNELHIYIYIMYINTQMTNKHTKDMKFKCDQKDANKS